MKDPTDKETKDMYEETPVKEFIWDDLQKKFVPYPFNIEDRKEEDK
jgi:hypothetical protein